MKLAYVTNVKIPAEDAQSIQVAAMAKAFNQKLGHDFLLVSPKTLDNKNFLTQFNEIIKHL